MFCLKGKLMFFKLENQRKMYLDIIQIWKEGNMDTLCLMYLFLLDQKVDIELYYYMEQDEILDIVQFNYFVLQKG